jgi:hemerythrin-like metal-binding protein
MMNITCYSIEENLMSFVSWSDDLSVGIDEIDNQHKQFIDMINELHLAMKSGKSATVLPQVLTKLGNYAVFHFSHEENVMQSYNFPEFYAHKMIHDKFTKEIKKLFDDLASQKTLLSIEVMNSLKDWLVSHIMGQDKKYGEHIKKRQM